MPEVIKKGQDLLITSGGMTTAKPTRVEQARDNHFTLETELAMYQVGGTAAGGLVVAGGASQLPGPGGALAREMLPFTGFACGLLLVVALVLIAVGLVMRKVGAVDA